MQFLPARLRRGAACAVLSFLAAPLIAANWPSWRGPKGDGSSPEKSVPLQWNATENVRWKIELPEPGDSSPVVWGDKVFLTQSFEKDGGRTVMCYDRRNGKLLWKSGTTWTQREQRYGKNPHCAASPVTDGERVIAFFGSAGLFCWDMDGKELWRRDLGPQAHEWSYAASPLLHGDVCVLYFGPGANARLIGLDKKSGKMLWEFKEPAPEARTRTDGFKGNDRGGMVGTFTTPIIARAGQRDELIQTFPQFTRAFDPLTGRALWHCDGLNELVYSSPVAGEGVLVAMGGFFGTSLAVKTGGSGDVTGSHRLWQTVRTKNRLGTGVITGGHVFILNTEGIAECLNLQTGESLWQERVKGTGKKGDSWSSMVLVDRHILCLNQSSETIVIKASPKFELVRVNSLDGDLANSTHAISNGEVFIRTHKHLWCIGSKP